MTSPQLVAGRRVVTGLDDEPRELTLELDDAGRIAAVHDGIREGARLVEGWLVPGFVDTHCHGGAGADFTDPDPSRVQAAIAHHRRHGSTTLFASTVTAGRADLAEQVRRLRPLVERGELAGIHLEGPFLSEARKGAHATELLGPPTDEALDELLAAGGGAVRMVTLAPELDNGLPAVRRLARQGVAAAFGHSDAEADLTRQAIDEGATVATHLFNAMRAVHHREPGPVPVLLHDERVTVELICDFVHLHADVIRLAIDAAGPARVALVTDAMSATGSPDGRYDLGQLPVEVRDGVARLVTQDGSAGAIAGSTLTMDVAVANLVGLGYSIVEASRMASTTPARAHRLDDVGVLRPGAWADWCLLDDDGQLQAVVRRGKPLTGAGVAGVG